MLTELFLRGHGVAAFHAPWWWDIHKNCSSSLYEPRH